MKNLHEEEEYIDSDSQPPIQTILKVVDVQNKNAFIPISGKWMKRVNIMKKTTLKKPKKK